MGKFILREHNFMIKSCNRQLDSLGALSFWGDRLRPCLNAVKSVLSPYQPTRVLRVQGKNFGLDQLAATIDLGAN